MGAGSADFGASDVRFYWCVLQSCSVLVLAMQCVYVVYRMNCIYVINWYTGYTGLHLINRTDAESIAHMYK